MAKRGHGEGSIYQRKKDGRWVGEITLEDGRRKQFYGKTRKEAYDKMQNALHEQKQGVLATGPQQTLKTYLEQWFEDVHKPSVRLSSGVNYQQVLNLHLLPTLGHIRLQKLTPQHVQSLYASKLREGLSARRIATIHGLLHKALENAVRTNLVARNVCDLVTPPRPKRHEIQPLTIEQAQKLLKTARGHNLEALLTVALATGMRRGELLALRWRDIDFENRSLQVRRSVNYVAGHGLVESEPKTSKSRRQIVLPIPIIEVIKKHQAFQHELRLKTGERWKESDLVFCNTIGNFLDPADLLRSFKALLKESGLPSHIRFHDLRHSAATMLLTMGVHPKVVQELLGHSQISMTLDTYSHVIPSLHEKAMEALGDLLRNGHEDVRD